MTKLTVNEVMAELDKEHSPEYKSAFLAMVKSTYDQLPKGVSAQDFSMRFQVFSNSFLKLVEPQLPRVNTADDLVKEFELGWKIGGLLLSTTLQLMEMLQKETNDRLDQLRKEGKL